MHRGPWALVPTLPLFAAAIDASLWRRTTGSIRPRVLTPEGLSSQGNVALARGTKPTIVSISEPRSGRFAGKRRHDFAREPAQLRHAVEDCQDDILDAGAAQRFDLLANLVRGAVERVGFGA